MSMMYNPTSVNAYEADDWPENPETQRLSNDSVDWNIFILQTENDNSANISYPENTGPSEMTINRLMKYY